MATKLHSAHSNESKYSSKTPFSVPDGYFELFEQKMQEKISKVEVFEGIEASKVKGDVQYVPSNYFEHLSEKIHQKIAAPQQLTSSRRLKTLYHTAIPLAVAASIALLVVVSINKKEINNSTAPAYVASTSSVSAVDVNAVMQVDEEIIIEALVKKAPKAAVVKQQEYFQEPTIDDLVANEFETEELEEYFESL